MEPQPLASDLVLRALRLFQDGDALAGVETYRHALDTSGGTRLPVGLHLMQLIGSGLTEAAEHVRGVALQKGADLSISWALHRLHRPRNSVAEYEALFASGLANPGMVNNCMVCLSRIGDSARLAALAAPETLFRQTDLRVKGPVAPLLDRVSAALRTAKERRFFESENAARNMDRVHRTHRLEDPAICELHAAIRLNVNEYLNEISQSGHLIANWIPADFELRSWAVISDGIGGHLVPHTHSGCWVIGVTYIEGDVGASSSNEHAGHLRIGAAPGGVADCLGWPHLSVAPTPGRIVLMPAFYTHWVEPVPSSTSRISVAFNVVDAKPGTSM